MSDYSDGSGQIPRRPRVGDGPAPVSGVVAIVLAVVAVVAGYLILRSITDNGESASSLNPGSESEAPSVTESTVPDNTTPVDSLPTSTEPPGLVVTGATVIVANANGTDGSAGLAGRVLNSSAGFAFAEPTNLSSSRDPIDTSEIYYVDGDAAAQTVANSLNAVLGGALTVQALPEPAPITDGNMKGATVLLLLGKDFAELAPGALNLTGITGATQAEVTNPPTGGSGTAVTQPAG